MLFYSHIFAWLTCITSTTTTITITITSIVTNTPLAAACPLSYWIEVITRAADSPVTLEYTLAQTMLRVKDPVKSLAFYRDTLGMDLLRQIDLGVGESWGFSLYFLANLTDEQRQNQPDVRSEEAGKFIQRMYQPVLELTHNHGTENQTDFHYHNGNDEDAGQLRGFGHTGYLGESLSHCSDRRSTVIRRRRRRSGDIVRIVILTAIHIYLLTLSLTLFLVLRVPTLYYFHASG